jgi:hypothetical protein
MDLCLSCQKFNLHAFSRTPDQACSYRLVAVEKAAREDCSFCKLLYQNIQPSIVKFPLDPNKCWVRMVTPTNREHKTSRRPGLQLSELEVFLANTAFETKAEERTDGVYLNLAADPGIYTSLTTIT